ncbi:MAG: lipoyl synthase [Magnetococcales bacterium]|nr:lipoyl synthase [Magnetococcales bacterium]
MRVPKPRWLRVKAPGSPGYLRIKQLTNRLRLGTVCESASCPNIGECWQAGGAAFMILGEICTRACAFCNVPAGRPAPPDSEEPQRLATAVAEMGLQHVVITSVSRDDLPDGGADHFVACVTAIRERNKRTSVELLIPDFRDKPGALEHLLTATPDVLNHNVETVPRLYPKVRPAANYQGSLELLAHAATHGGVSQIKSGIMLGLGEEEEEVLSVLTDLRRVGVTCLTIGQYLAPSRHHIPVVRYWPPECFAEFRQKALEMGFSQVESHPLARSSFHAEEMLTNLE